MRPNSLEASAVPPGRLPNLPPRPKVLIVGGGFAGLERGQGVGQDAGRRNCR